MIPQLEATLIHKGAECCCHFCTDLKRAYLKRILLEGWTLVPPQIGEIADAILALDKPIVGEELFKRVLAQVSNAVVVGLNSQLRMRSKYEGEDAGDEEYIAKRICALISPPRITLDQADRFIMRCGIQYERTNADEWKVEKGKLIDELLTFVNGPQVAEIEAALERLNRYMMAHDSFGPPSRPWGISIGTSFEVALFDGSYIKCKTLAEAARVITEALDGIEKERPAQ